VEEGGSEEAAFSAVARSSRATPTAIALAAIAVVSVALLTKPPAPPASAPTAGVTPGPPLVEVLTSPEARPMAPTHAQMLGAPSRNPTASPYPVVRAVPVVAGTTELVPAGSASVRLTIRLPDGWARASDATYVRPGGTAPALVSIGAWSLRQVNVFPCRWSAAVTADDQLMRTAAGQAQALSSWWGQDPGMPPDSNAGIAPVATKPQLTTLGNYPAWRLEVLIPSDFDMTQCDGGQTILWESANGDVRSGLGPGELIRVWVADIDGVPIVIEGSTFLTTPSAAAAELQAIIDSMVLQPSRR
jgi:hypothetical protein